MFLNQIKLTRQKQWVPLALPLLVAVYPVVFLYAVNAKSLQIGSLLLPLGVSVLVACAVIAVFYLLLRSPIPAGLAAAIFLIAYDTYGSIYQGLVRLDRFQVQHFILFPLVALLAVYAGLLSTLIKQPIAVKINQVLLLVALALVGYNLANILFVEVQKDWPKNGSVHAAKAPVLAPVPAQGPVSAPASAAFQGKRPDIYFIIFDEYAGFDVVRDYWHMDYVNAFEDFLNKNHFFVATDSHSVTINTQTELSSRLSLHQYTERDDPDVTLDQIDHNKVMQILKSYGYQTVAIDMAFNQIQADESVQFNSQEVGGMAADEYRQSFVNNSMLSAFSEYFVNEASAEKQRDMILFALNKTTSLGEVKSPKFVFTHVLLPHMPFIFDANGNLISPEHADDWHYYIGQHQYATKLAQDLITRLLKNADPANPPVIILQSDHGARNLVERSTNNIYLNGYLENYPPEYTTHILNALYLPGFDTSTLAIDMPPIDTFEIVLNHYFNAGVSVDPP